MYGLTANELRFALLISSAHFSQHIYYRILPPLIPVLAVALHYPLWQLGLLISLYSLGMGVAQAPLGVLSDRIDRRYLLPTGLSITGAAYVLFAIAPTLGSTLTAISVFSHTFSGGFLVMSLAMIIVGLGLAVVHPTSYPMITDNANKANKGKVLGLFGASSKLGDATAPAIIAGLILVLAWHQIIMLFGITGILYGIALYIVLRDPQYETIPTGQRTTEPDNQDENPDDHDRRRFLYPMVAVYLYFISSMLSTRTLSVFLPAFIVAVYAYSFTLFDLTIGAESVANIYFSLLLVSGAAMQLFLGGITDNYDSRKILLGCMALATIGMVTLAIADLHPLILLPVIIVLGTGLYGVNPARDALISDLSPSAYEGRTFGYIFTAVTLTGTPLPAIIGYILEVIGMRGGFLLLAIGPVFAAICITLLFSDRVYLAEPQIDSNLTSSD